jgi:phosphatidylserine decarboxylase
VNFDFVKLKKLFPPIHRDGFVFASMFAAATLASMFLAGVLVVPCVILTIWCIYFFRDPNRVVPDGKEYIVSPADGIVTKITDTVLPPVLNIGKLKVKKISVFLNVFDVHVNRVPASGEIVKIHYHPGTFINASLDKASDENEKNYCVMRLKSNGKLVVFVQIAGLIARRIVCDIKEGQNVSIGERYGIIRFGSRMDVYLPEGYEPLVKEGQRVVAGETIFGKIGAKAIKTILK